ncbi:ABC transporter permease family protein [Mangrovicoccus ximenensis]|uniref:hypothetical protein n=1 Tax=Mangrovicoccus ximenensis TaxID=1911570 RepID=UPI001374FFEF|nr:hypothetical protein [Mangrovicoccus ximenensis]
MSGIFTRLLQAAMVALLIGAATFAMMRSLPGDAAWRIAAGRYGYDHVDAAAAEAVRAELGLGGPWLPGLLQWLGDLMRLDFGTSLVSGRPVIDEIVHQLGASAGLALAAMALALLIGPPLGILAGLMPRASTTGTRPGRSDRSNWSITAASPWPASRFCSRSPATSETKDPTGSGRVCVTIARTAAPATSAVPMITPVCTIRPAVFRSLRWRRRLRAVPL